VIKARYKWVEAKDAKPAPFDIAIVGGGFSGSLLAIQLLRQEPELRIAVVDGGNILGRGLAYRTNYLCHVLNVPARGMSAFPDDPEHFLRWVRRNHDEKIQPQDFLPRAIYGDYLDSLLKESATRAGRNLPWFRDQALTITRTGEQFSLQLKSGRTLCAKAAVIATGNVPPGDPTVPGLSEGAKRYVSFSWTDSALDGMRGTSEVLLIGAGLTSTDLALALASKGFRGRIHMLSRRGLTPQTHRPSEPWPQFWNEHSPRTARGLMRLVREQVREASEAGIDWRGVVDALRPVIPQIWRSLPDEERRRFMRHARAYWDVHRHRVAPEVSERLARLMREGRIVLHAGRVTGYREEKELAAVMFRRRRDGKSEEIRVGRVINCTGPEADWRRIDNSLLSSLFAQGLARPDALFLGLDVDEHGCVVNDQGETSNSLFAIGPVRKGCLWETTAVPELRKQAADLAQHIVQCVRPEPGIKLSESPA
jgi:uncharacterized NAD(P)/FAD-binding protein YdhS